MAGILRTTGDVPTYGEGMTNPKNQRPYKLHINGFQSHGEKRTPVTQTRAFKHFVTAQNAAFDDVCSGPRGTWAQVMFEPKDGRVFPMLVVRMDDACRTVVADLQWRRALAVKANQAAYGMKEGEV